MIHTGKYSNEFNVNKESFFIREANPEEGTLRFTKVDFSFSITPEKPCATNDLPRR